MKRLLILLLLFIPLVYANVEPTDKYELYQNFTCDDTFKLRIVQKVPVDYNINCELNSTNLYTCNCSNVIFQQLKNTNNVYNFIYEYYIGSKEEINKRQLTKNNVVFGKTIKHEKLEFPKFENMNFILWFIGLIFFIVGTIMIIIIKEIYDKEEIDEYE